VRVASGVAALLLVVVGSVCRSAGFFIHDIYWLQEDLGGDKATHVWMGVAVTFALWLLLAKRWTLRWVVMLATLLLLVDEISQFWLPTRSFSMEDFGMGVVGVVVATAFIFMFVTFCSRTHSPGQALGRVDE
jgi:VanZ family protein